MKQFSKNASLFHELKPVFNWLIFYPRWPRILTPLLITDLLARFTDEDERQVDELFFACQIELERLCKASLLFVSAAPRPPLERLGFALQQITHALEYGRA